MSKEQWDAWLSSIPVDQQNLLFEALAQPRMNERDFRSIVRGEAIEDETPGTKMDIRRTPLDDLFVQSPPPYLDVFHLHEVYKTLAFKSNVMVKGPKGDGKSLSVITYAHATQSPIIIQECSEDTKKMDLMGSQTLVGDQTIFTLGCIPAAIETANEYGRCILLFEELSALTPQVQKMLNAVTDFRKQCSMPFLGKTYKLRPDAYLWVVGTLNPSVYGGTYDLNEDLKSRFEEIDLTYPEPGVEKRIIQLACQHVVNQKMPEPYRMVTDGQTTDLWYVDDSLINLFIKLAGETRQQATGYAISTRDLVRAIETVAVLGVQKTLQLILCKFEGEEDKGTMKKRISSIFGTATKVANYWS